MLSRDLMAYPIGCEDLLAAPTSLLIACEWKWADRIKASLAETQFQIFASRSEQPKGLPASSTHGGYMWVRVAGELSESLKEMRYSQFERHTAGIFPTRHSIQDLTNLAGELSLHPAWRTVVSQKRFLRLHVYDADFPTSGKLMEEIEATLLVHTCIELSPTEFQLVLVVVRVSGCLQWELLLPAQYTLIKKQYGKDRSTCRAAHKLHDALQIVEGGNFVVDKSLPALDVGASPGGWTEVLLENGFAKVVAIDPGKMSEPLMASHGDRIQHLAMTAEDAVGSLDGQQFSIIVCDVNAEARMILLDMLLPMLTLLRIGSPLILTLKLPKRGTSSAIAWALESARKLLVGYVEDLNVYHLFGNTVHERTLIGIRCKGTLGAEHIAKEMHQTFSQCDKEDDWKSSLLSLETWVTNNNGQLPMRYSRDKQERNLAIWMFKQRKHHATNDSRVGWLEQVAHLEQNSWWSWAIEEEDFLNALTMLQDWVAANAGLPDQIVNMLELPPHQDKQKAFLASWIVAQRHRKILKHMDAKHEAMLNKCPYWSWEFDWAEHAESCTFHSDLTANRCAKVDRVLGPRFRCTCGHLYFCRAHMASCYGRHLEVAL